MPSDKSVMATLKLKSVQYGKVNRIRLIFAKREALSENFVANVLHPKLE